MKTASVPIAPPRPLRRPVALLLLALAGQAGAQPGSAAGSSSWSGFATVTPVYQWNADLDRGGGFGSSGVLVRLGASRPFGRTTQAGLTLNYDAFDYRFSNPVAFGNQAPWGNAQRVGFSVPINHSLGNGWTATFAPSFDWFGERGARGGDSFTWGAIVAGTKTWADGRRLGVGLGAFDRFNETTVFPYLVVDWPLSERVKLTNPAAAGPTGPAGLELRYRADGGWDLGIGGAWRSTRFRLSETGRVANGVGEERGLPLFLRASRAFAPGAAFNLYAGAIVAGSLRLEDSSGARLATDDFGIAPFLGASLGLRY
jgi:hypothetical protein